MSRSRLNLARQASRTQLKAHVAIDGPTGSGKTWTALEWGFILADEGDRPLVIDTERGSAEWYSDQFPPYDTITWTPPYDPGELADTIRDAAEQYGVVIVDSLSHFWEGEGGTRDIVDAAAERARGNTYAGWKVGTPALRRLVDQILAADAHVLVTMRSKMEYVLEEDERGRKVPKKVGMAPVMRSGVEYEFTVVADMDPEHRMLITKSRCSAIADQMAQPHQAGELARRFRAWLDGGERPITEAQARELAAVLNAAGQEARRAWLARFGCKPTALPESRLKEARAFVAELAAGGDDPGPDGGPGGGSPLAQMIAEEDAKDAPRREALAEAAGVGNGQGPGGAADREAVDSHDAAPTPPRPANRRAAYTPQDVARRAQQVFKGEYDAAPRGHKTKVVDRLRHALVYAMTGGETSSLKDLDEEQLGRVWQRLDDIQAGRITYEADPLADNAGVTWRSQSGKETTVLWADVEDQEAAA